MKSSLLWASCNLNNLSALIHNTVFANISAWVCREVNTCHAERTPIMPSGSVADLQSHFLRRRLAARWREPSDQGADPWNRNKQMQVSPNRRCDFKSCCRMKSRWQRRLRYDFDFLFPFQEVVDDLVKNDFLFGKRREKPVRHHGWCACGVRERGRNKKIGTLPSGVLGPL